MTSPNVSFAQIPASIRKPGAYFEYNNSLAVRGLPTNLQRVLIVAQMLATGTAAANTVVGPMLDADTAAGLFGRGSQAHRMVRAALTANRTAQIYVLPVADAGGGVVATGTLTVTNNATSAGQVVFNVAGVDVTVNVANGDTPTVVATAIVAAITALPNLPVTANNALGVVTLTQRNKGTVGNAHRLSVTSITAGATAVAAVAFSAGATDPALATALANAYAGGHEILVVPYGAAGQAMTDLKAHLVSVSGPTEARPAIGVYATGGTLSAATTAAGTFNFERFTTAFIKNTVTPAEEVAAAYAAVLAFEEDPARPLNNLVLAGVTVPAIADRLSRTEQETCLANGVTPIIWAPGDNMVICRAVTTYTLNAASVADVSWLDVTTIRTMDYCMKAWRTRISLRFPRAKLSARTPPLVRSELLDVAYQLESGEIIENVDLWKADLVVERDLQDANRLNAKIPVDVVNGLHVFAGVLNLIL